MTQRKPSPPSPLPKKSVANAATVSNENIVSSAHLMSPKSREMSEFEYGLIVANNAFSRWITLCMGAAGLPDLTPLEVLLIHHVHHRARDKRLADICFILNIEDVHLVNYALKKLQNLGVIASVKKGKEVTYHTTEQGGAFIEHYRDIRENCLITALKADANLNKDIAELARLLRLLSGVYDQASRAAALF